MRRNSRPFAAGALALAVLVPLAAPVGAAPEDTAAGAVDWLVAQQQDDGGFEMAGFPGFETPDAVLAIAAAAQTGAGWDQGEAYDAVVEVARAR